MRKKILLLLLVVTSMMGQVRAQNTGTTTASACDSVAYQVTFYFQSGGSDWIQESDYKKMDRLLRWAQTDSQTSIQITGWADKSGIEAVNQKISLRRARTIRNYLVQKGIASERITFEGQSVDAQASDNNKARRADVRGVIRLTVEAEPKQTTPFVALQPATEVQPTTEQQPKQEVVESVQEQPVAVQTVVDPTSAKTQSANNLRWYAVAGAGASFGRGTFCSFAADGIHPGWNISVATGRRINRLLSAEVSIDYTRLRLGAYDCCTDLWLGADGNRYFAPVAGMDSYCYNDLRSTCNLVSLGMHLNVNLIAIRQADSRWSAFVSPAIYAVYSDAKVKQGGIEAGSASGLHFGLGADLGVQYMFTPQWGLRLTSGISYITGKPIDVLPREEHKSNYIWNTALKVIFKL